jgi:hypothetical protein
MPSPLSRQTLGRLEHPGQALALARNEQVFGLIILDVAAGVAQP